MDDSPDIRIILREFLDQLGYDVVEAGDGVAAIQWLRQSDVAAIVTDLIMPDADGLDVIAAARSMQPGVRIVGITGGGAYIPLDCCQKLMERLGAQSVLTKPLQFQQLAAALGSRGASS